LTVQAVPSQCSMSVASPLPDSVNPTAHTSVADLAKTDWNMEPSGWPVRG